MHMLSRTALDSAVYVHDLDLFLTVKILEDTPAVLSPGKLCEDHGYSYEWASGQKPHLNQKRGRKYHATRRLTYLSLFRTCQSDLPASLRVHPQHRFRRTQWKMIFHQVQQPHDVGIRRVEHWRTSCKIPQKPKNEDIDRVQGIPLHDLPEWLAKFTDNFVDEEVSASSEAPPSISREPRHQEPSVKVVSGKHSILTRFPERPKLGPRIQQLLAENALVVEVLRAEIFGDLITADHTALGED